MNSGVTSAGITLVLLVMAACASQVASSKPAGPCTPRDGTYLAHYEPQSGNCPQPADQVKLSGAEAPDATCTSSSSVSTDRCDVILDQECAAPTLGEGFRLREVGKIKWTHDGATGTGVIQRTIIRPDKTVGCDSTFLLTSTRQ